ncbi:methyltransferase domain-containing protein [Methanocalculus sp. MC3]
MDEIKIDTYKSVWYQDIETGNYIRCQKEFYQYETYLNPIKPLLGKIPLFRCWVYNLTRKEQGVDYYKYYVQIIEPGIHGDRGKWNLEFDTLHSRLNNDMGISLNGKRLLDISGEPGFFGFDAKAIAKTVVVTAFADEVACVIQDKLDLKSYKYNFNEDSLINIFDDKSFDFIFVRSAIGFCEDIKVFFEECYRLLSKDGCIYISFSPASRAVCARWMFDDYTYLRQYTKDYMLRIAQSAGFSPLMEWDDGSYLWDKDFTYLHRFFTKRYVTSIFSGLPENEKKQHNLGLLMKKIDI